MAPAYPNSPVWINAETATGLPNLMPDNGQAGSGGMTISPHWVAAFNVNVGCTPMP